MSDALSTLNHVATSLVDSGVYDASEVGYLLGVSVERVVAWSAPDARGRPAIVAPTFDRAFSFADLVSLAVVRELSRRRITGTRIRAGVQYLGSELGYEKPLAQQQVVEMIATSGTSFIARLGEIWIDIGQGGQGAFDEIVNVYLRKISHNEIGVAQSWRPTELVLLDPRIQAGAPCLEGTRVPTATVAELLEHDSRDVVADDLDLTDEQVRAAEAFERELAAGSGLAA